MLKLYDLFIKKDIILLEINPLTEAADGKIYCLYFKNDFFAQTNSDLFRYGLQDQCR